MPKGKNSHISRESASLQDERDLDQDLACHVFCRAVGGIGSFGCTVGDHELDEQVDTDERCQNSARMEGREPGNVVEGAGEEEVRCAGVDWSGEVSLVRHDELLLKEVDFNSRAREKQNDACNQDSEVFNVECPNFSHDEPSDH